MKTECHVRSRSSLLIVLVAVLGSLTMGSNDAVGVSSSALSYRFVETPAGVGAHLLSADLARVELRLLHAADLGKTALTARQFAELSGATAVFNGPFFDLDGSGQIDTAELYRILVAVGAQITVAQVEDIVAKCEARFALQARNAAILEGIPLFADLPKTTLLKVVDCLECVEYGAGDAVIREGDQYGSHMFVCIGYGPHGIA